MKNYRKVLADVIDVYFKNEDDFYEAIDSLVIDINEVINKRGAEGKNFVFTLADVENILDESKELIMDKLDR